MNWLLVIVLAIILFSAVIGARKGFLRLLFSLIAVILLVGLVAYATPHVSGYIQEHTKLGAVISDHVAGKIENSMETAVDSAVDSQAQSLEAAGIHLPEILQEAIFEKGVDAAEGAIAQTGIYQQMGDQVAGIVLAVISFVIALVIALLILFVIGKVTDLANKIPVIKGINRFFGFFAGGFLGFVLVWLIFMLIGIMSGTSLGQLLLEQIQENQFLSVLYNDNLLLEIIVQFFGK